MTEEIIMRELAFLNILNDMTIDDLLNDDKVQLLSSKFIENNLLALEIDKDIDYVDYLRISDVFHAKFDNLISSLIKENDIEKLEIAIYNVLKIFKELNTDITTLQAFEFEIKLMVTKSSKNGLIEENEVIEMLEKYSNININTKIKHILFDMYKQIAYLGIRNNMNKATKLAIGKMNNINMFKEGEN